MFDTFKFIREIQRRPAIYDAQSEDYGNKEAKEKCWSEIGEAVYEDWNDMPHEKEIQMTKELTKKWKGLRDNFVRDQKSSKTQKKRKYLYFEQLLFLLPHLKGKENAASNGQTKSDEDTSSHLTDPKKEEEEDDEEEEECPDQDKQQTTRSLGDRGRLRTRKRKIIRAGVRKSITGAGSCTGDRTPATNASNNSALLLPKTAPLQRGESSGDRFGNRAFLLSFAPIMDNMTQHQFLQARMKIAEIFSELC